MEDGRTLSGFVTNRDERVTVLKHVDGQTSVIENAEIEELHKVPRSLMPVGLLKTLEPQQIRDLFAYLRASQPLP